MNLILALVAGGALGVIFFGGLWYTVRLGLRSKQSALIFTASLILRMAIVLVGFYYIGADNWQKMLAVLVGFLIARIIITRITQKDVTSKNMSEQ
ncbi:MAG: ATP synthase subunit I [Balneolaceae bacterium]